MRWFCVLALGLAACLGGEPPKGADTADSATTGDDTGTHAGSASCYLDDQFLCNELPDGTETDVQNLAIACSSGSGDFLQPAACPSAAYEGKCTYGTGTDQTIQRFYTGADVGYAADYCENSAGGSWTTEW